MKKLSLLRCIGVLSRIDGGCFFGILQHFDYFVGELSCKTLTTSNLLMETKSVDFYISLEFMKNILYKMKFVTLENQRKCPSSHGRHENYSARTETYMQ